MSWASKVRDNAQVRLKKPPTTLQWNPAATAVGHFRPAFQLNEEDERRDVPLQDVSEIARDASDDNTEQIISGPNESTGVGTPLEEHSVIARHQTSALHNTNQKVSCKDDALAWMNAEEMDPFVSHERETSIALQGVRRSVTTFLGNELQRVFVTIPPAPELLTNPELSFPPSDAPPIEEVSHAHKKPPKAAKGVSPKPGDTPTQAPSNGAEACHALIASKLTSAQHRSMSLNNARALLRRLEKAASTAIVKMDESGVAQGAITPPTTGRHQKKSSGSVTPLGGHSSSPAADSSSTMIQIPDHMVTVLKSYGSCVAAVVDAYESGATILERLHAPSAHMSSSLPLIRASPCYLSKGLSMAAREIALNHVDQPQHSAAVKCSSPVDHRRSPTPIAAEGAPDASLDFLSDPDVVCRCTASPSCGAYLTARTVSMFGKCDVSQLSAHVVLGQWSPREIVVLWVLRCLLDCTMEGARQQGGLANSKADYPRCLLPLHPNKVCIGIGWQRHPVYGAITVCLATPSFDELQFTTHHSLLLPMHEISRYVTHGLASKSDTTHFPIRFAEQHKYGIRAMEPTTHPIEPSRSSEVQVLLEVPIAVEIACTVVQVDAPPQTPFYGRKLVDTEMKIARRKGKPLALVPQEPRYSTSSCLVDFPPSTLGTVARVTVRLVSHRQATLHIFAKLATQTDGSFHKVSSIEIHPSFSEEDWLAAQGIDSNPLNTNGLPVTSEMFQRWRGCVVCPLTEVIADGSTMVPFEVFLPHGTHQCVLKGSHGVMPLHPCATSARHQMVESTTPTPHVWRMHEEQGGSAASDTSLPPISTRRCSSHTSAEKSTSTVLSPVRRRGGSHANTTLFKGVLQRAREGPLQLWVDGFVVCQWNVAF